MFRICILLYGLTLTEAYTVKVSGKVELGNKLSKLVRDLYSQVVESGVVPEHFLNNDESGPAISAGKKQIELSQESGEDPETFIDKTRQEKKYKKKREKRVVDDATSPTRDILDKMTKKDLEKLHLYGYHKSPKKGTDYLGKPLNNVHI